MHTPGVDALRPVCFLLIVGVKVRLAMRKKSILLASGVFFLLAAHMGRGDSCGAELQIRGDTFLGINAGAETNVAGVRLCWCPAGKFIMGSPRNELERRPGEDQVPV